jgi:hypothetical protein
VSGPVDKLCAVATFNPPSLPDPDSFAWRQIQDAARYFNANRESIERAARMANEMRPYIEMMAPTIRAIESMRRDMNIASILARQQSAFAAIAWNVQAPTEAELAKTQDRMDELLPETEEGREQLAEQAAEIQADPAGKQLIGQAIDWVNEAMARLGDLATKHKTGLGLLLIGWLVIYVIPHADQGTAGLLCAAAAAWLAYRALPPTGK